MGAQETEIEASFHGAISTAKQQKATSLLTRVKATYAAYRRRKSEVSEGQAILLPLC
jgi:hypothetical protein